MPPVSLATSCLLIVTLFSVATDAASKRKKRKTDAAGSSSMSPQLQSSLAKERNISPLSVRDEGHGSLSSGSLVVPTPEKEKKRSNSKSNIVTGSTTPSLQRRGTLTKDGHPSSGSASGQSNSSSAIKESFKDLSSTSGYVDPARARREVLAHQLPLQKGRKVAFRQPSKNKVGPGAANMSTMTSRSAASANAPGSVQGYTTGQGGLAVPDDEGETWIMATIIECINNDRNRYVVQDAEDTAIMPTYNTTLKAIVPLPESLTTLPLEDYKVGAQVMGLYPDTSCFYRAIVRGGGPGLSGKLTAKVSAGTTAKVVTGTANRQTPPSLSLPYRCTAGQTSCSTLPTGSSLKTMAGPFRMCLPVLSLSDHETSVLLFPPSVSSPQCVVIYDIWVCSTVVVHWMV